RHTIFSRDWSSDVCSSDLVGARGGVATSLPQWPWAQLAAPAAPVNAPAGVRSTAWVEATLSGLTLREKVAQMVMPWIPGGELNRSEERRCRERVRSAVSAV